MGNFTTGAYGSIPIVISPRSVDHIIVKETSPTIKSDASASDGERQAWKRTFAEEKMRAEIDGSARELTREDIDEAYDSLENAALRQGRTLKFEEDQESGINIIKVLDADTGEVIRQMPPDELVQMARKLKNFGRGWVDLVG